MDKLFQLLIYKVANFAVFVIKVSKHNKLYCLRWVICITLSLMTGDGNRQTNDINVCITFRFCNLRYFFEFYLTNYYWLYYLCPLPRWRQKTACNSIKRICNSFILICLILLNYCKLLPAYFRYLICRRLWTKAFKCYKVTARNRIYSMTTVLFIVHYYCQFLVFN